MAAYKDSYGYGLAVLLALLSAWVDMLVVRYILALAAATLFLWPSLHRRFGMTPAVTAMLVCVVGFLCAGAWHVITTYFLTSGGNSEAAIAKNPLDHTILVECRWAEVPAVVSDNLYVLNLANNSGDGAPVSMSGVVGTAIEWVKRESQHWAACHITNYGTSPIIEIEADFSVNYQESISQENSGVKSGKIIASKTVHNPPARLGSSTSDRSTFTFYLWNYSPHHVVVLMPETARVKLAGSNEVRIVQLIRPAETGRSLVSLWPRIPKEMPPKDPPAEPLPSPEPPK